MNFVDVKTRLNLLVTTGGTLGIGDVYAAHVGGAGGGGVIAELDKDAMLNLVIEKGPSTPSGGEMFNEALAAYGGNVKGVRGNWNSGGTLADNFNSFKAAMAGGKMTAEQAAFETFTGKMSYRAGFTKARVTVNDATHVEVEFTK